MHSPSTSGFASPNLSFNRSTSAASCGPRPAQPAGGGDPRGRLGICEQIGELRHRVARLQIRQPQPAIPPQLCGRVGRRTAEPLGCGRIGDAAPRSDRHGLRFCPGPGLEQRRAIAVIAAAPLSALYGSAISRGTRPPLPRNGLPACTPEPGSPPSQSRGSMAKPAPAPAARATLLTPAPYERRQGRRALFDVQCLAITTYFASVATSRHTRCGESGRPWVWLNWSTSLSTGRCTAAGRAGRCRRRACRGAGGSPPPPPPAAWTAPRRASPAARFRKFSRCRHVSCRVGFGSPNAAA